MTTVVPPFESPLQLWFLRDESQEDVNVRLVRNNTFFDEQQQTDCDLPFYSYAQSQNTSTLAHVSEHDTDSTASDNVPGLTHTHSRTSSYSSLDSDVASVIDGGCVLSIDDGVLTRPARHRPGSNLLCPFNILNCAQVFADMEEFRTHVFYHFRGHPLPEFAPCFICGRQFFQQPGDDRALAWDNMLNHMVYDHYRFGDNVFVLRPNICIMRYMWDRNIITDAEYSRVQLDSSETRFSVANREHSVIRGISDVLPMAPSAPLPTAIREHLSQPVGSHNEPFVVFASRRQDRRHAGRLRVRAP